MTKMEKTTLFKAREGGYHNYRIPGLVVTPNGVLLAYCEARRDNGGDFDVINILMRRSEDGGDSWSDPVCVADHCDFPEKTMNNFVCIPDHDEACVHALFCNGYHRGYYMASKDDGVTWSEPTEVTSTFDQFRSEYEWVYCAFGPGHGIQLSSGRLISPIWLSPGTKGHLPNRAGAVYSDDHGQTWCAGGMLDAAFENTNETCVVELSDGRVMFNTRMRSEDFCRMISFSPDGRGNWSTPRKAEDLVDPICHAGMIRYDESTILFSNPDSQTQDLPGCWPGVHDRRNLTIKASHDEGETWPVKKVLEPGPSGYSDLAVLPDKAILCIYEDGMKDKMGDTAQLTVARFDIDWLNEK